MTNNTSATEKLKPCIACKRDLYAVFNEPIKDDLHTLGQPSGAVIFYGSGAYGSSHDESPLHGEYVVNICDDCMNEAIKNNEVRIRIQKRENTYHEVTTYSNDN